MALVNKKITNTDKFVAVVNLTPVRFLGGTENYGRAINIQGAWYPEILVAVFITVNVPVEEALGEIVMKARDVVIYMDCDVKAS